MKQLDTIASLQSILVFNCTELLLHFSSSNSAQLTTRIETETKFATPLLKEQWKVLPSGDMASQETPEARQVVRR